MEVIHKYTLNQAPGRTRLKMPAGAKVLTFQMQDGKIVGWFELWPQIPNQDAWFETVPTGGEVPEDGAYVATVQDGTLVWHIYRLAP